jgi:soluble lytic murein transglycosylase-like protein
MKRALLTAAAVLSLIPSAFAEGENYQAMVASHAAANDVPVSLVHRVIMRESRYNPRAISKGNYGMMQIRLGTARGLGYTGTAQGLLDPETNLTYAVKYLAGAYQLSGGNETQAVRYYAAGYYYAAKRQRQLAQAQPALFDANAELLPARTRHHRHHRHD